MTLEEIKLYFGAEYQEISDEISRFDKEGDEASRQADRRGMDAVNEEGIKFSDISRACQDARNFLVKKVQAMYRLPSMEISLTEGLPHSLVPSPTDAKRRFPTACLYVTDMLGFSSCLACEVLLENGEIWRWDRTHGGGYWGQIHNPEEKKTA